MKKKNTGFLKEIQEEILSKKSNICVGLDSDIEKIPQIIKGFPKKRIIEFNKKIIDATADLVVAYKLNLAFYYFLGEEGIETVKKTNEYIRRKYPKIKIIADVKRSEMLRSSELVAKEMFGTLDFDAFTQTPWFGFDTVEPFLNYENKAVFVICHDSNPSAKDLQDVKLKTGEFLYEHVVKLVNKWNRSGNILIEAPLTYPNILEQIVNKADDDQFFLLAGLGAQGGDIKNLKIFKKDNFLVSASRSIIFASSEKEFHEEARNTALKYQEELSSLNLQ